MPINNNIQLINNGNTIGASQPSAANRTGGTAGVQKSGSNPNAQGLNSVPEDQAQLSPVTRLLASGQSDSPQAASHQLRLDELQTAVDNGTYHVSPSVLADSMMREWLAA